MWSTWIDIHTCLIDLSFAHALFDKLKQLVLWLDMHLSKSFHKYTSFRVFSNLETTWYFTNPPDWSAWVPNILVILSGSTCTPWYASGWPRTAIIWLDIKEVCDHLHVYFQEWDSDSELAFVWVSLDVVEHMIDSSGN